MDEDRKREDFEKKFSFKIFYDANRHLFEIAAFLGVIGGILLQAGNVTKEVKLLQALFHTSFLLILTWILLLLLRFTVQKIKMSQEKTLLGFLNTTYVNLTLSTLFAIFITNYLLFSRNNFGEEIFELFKKIRVPLYLIALFQFPLIEKVTKEKTNEKFAGAIRDTYLVCGISYALFYIFPPTHATINDPKSYPVPFAILIIIVLINIFYYWIINYFPKQNKVLVYALIFISGISLIVDLYFIYAPL